MSLEPGQMISQYRLLERQGEGGMGVVWRAVDTRLDREVALKILAPHIARNPELLERFRREARAIAALNHPNIVTIHGVEEHDGVPFIAMELLEGAPLGEMIPERGLPLERFFDLAIPIADALRSAHDRGIIHRDLKPSNIMVSPEGRPKILDFGLAKLRQEQPAGSISGVDTNTLTREGRILGTMPYMSPEQTRGDETDARSDIFSLGIILYELATGGRPFRGSTAADLVSSILRDTPVPATSRAPELPRRLDGVISRCLEKNPERRYQSSADLRDDLLEARTVVTSGKARYGPPPLAGLRGRPLALIGAAILAIVALTWLLRPAPSTPQLPPPRPIAADSVAVLPFVNLSAEENDYLAAGMTEELIGALARVPGLRVPGRTSVFALKQAGLTIRQIGEQLGVAAVLEGSVRIADDRLRVTAQLINARDEFQIWSETFDREMKDVFAIQEEISRAIVRNLRIRLVQRPGEPIVRPLTHNLEAYNLYLQGRHHWNRRTADALERAVDLFSSSVERDPDFALAYAGLADAWVLLPERSDVPGSEVFPKAREAALKALALDDALSEAHTSLGQVLRLYDRNHEASEAEFRRAIELNPEYATAHHWLGMNLFFDQGRREEGLAHIERAETLDPLSGVIKYSLGGVLRMQGQVARAIEKYNELRDLDPTYPIHNALSSAHFQNRDFRASVDALLQKRARGRFDLEDWISLTGTLHLAGDHATELKEALALRAESPDSWNAVFLQARALLGLGRAGELWRVIQEGSELPTSFSAGPHLLGLAEELHAHGLDREATHMARRAMEFYGTVRDLALPAEPAYRFAVSSALHLAGRTPEARTLFDRAAADDRLGARILPTEEFHGYSGSYAALTGDEKAARAHEKKLATSDEIEKSSRLFWEAAIAASLGERSRAVALIEESFDAGYWTWGRLHRLPFMDPLWDFPPFRNLLQEHGLPLPRESGGKQPDDAMGNAAAA